MDGEKDINKIIDKYRIEKILEIKANNIYIMQAVNLNTGEHFVIKKAKININANSKNSSKSNQTKQSNSQSGLLYSQVNCIKDMNLPKVLRCLQMIKTKRNLYLVYQNYPEMNLEQYIKERSPIPALKIKFAKLICQFLQEMHKKKYVYINMTPHSIFVISGSNLNPSSYQLRFVGFEYALKLNDSQVKTPINLGSFQQNIYLAPQVMSGTVSFQSDVFSAGKIFQLLGITQIKCKTDQKLANETISNMVSKESKSRPNLNQVWQCLKQKQNESRIFDYKILQLQSSAARLKMDAASTTSKQKSLLSKNLQKKNVEDEERRIKKIIKIRTLVIYLHDLANYVLKQKSKLLYYMLFKKSIIVRANLMHEIKKMLNLYSGEHYSQLSKMRQILGEQQNQALDLFTKVEQILDKQIKETEHMVLKPELQNRNQINQKLIQQLILQFVNKKKKQIKPFHSILDEVQRRKLIYLCGLTQKIVYGSFEKFFDEVVDDAVIQLHKQKYFGYLKAASTKQIYDRLDKILSENQKK